jgi:hypothetical protein
MVAACFASILIATTANHGRSESSVPPSGRELPYPVTSFGSAIHDNQLYIYGGHRGKPHKYHVESTSGEFLRLSLNSADSEWQVLSTDTASQGTRLTAWNGRILRVGGMQPRNRPEEDWDIYSLDEFKAWDPVKAEWESLRSMPKGRSSHEIVISGDTLYVAGGWNLTGDSEEAEWFTTMYSINLSDSEASWQEHPQPFTKRAIAAAASADSLVFIGGMDDYDNVSDTVDIYNVRTGEWTKGPSVPDVKSNRMKSFGAAAASRDGKIYLSDHSGKIYTLSETMDKWSEVGELASPRFFHRVEFDSAGRAVVVGGASRSLGQFNTIEFLALTE